MQVIRFEKAPGDNRVWGVNFFEFPEAIALDTISSASANADAGINVLSSSNLTVSGYIVLFQVSGGTSGTTYRITITSTWASGASIIAFVDVVVTTPSTGN